MSTDALRQWVADNTGLTAIWLHPNAPRPDTPFASVQVLQVARVGEPYRTPVDYQGNATVTVNRDVTVSIVVYESDDSPDPRAALERADALRDTLDLETVRETLAANGWTFRAVELLTDTPSAGQTDWEPRATFDVRFGIGREIAEELGLVETVIYEADIDDRAVTFSTDIAN